MIVQTVPQPRLASNADPVRQAADDLHRQFLAEMLKQAKLAEAFGGGTDGPNLGGALIHEALNAIAADIAATQPGFADSLYEALRRAEPGST